MNIKKILAVVAATIVLSVPAMAQCPGITIDQRVDHRRSQLHINMGWDTAITCESPKMTLTSTVFVPYEYFNGTYKVESIPYDPPEDFDLRSMLRGTAYDSATYNYPADGPVNKLYIPDDDIFDYDSIKIDFPFSFFGYVKTGAVVGDNGMLTFNTAAASGVRTPASARMGNAYGTYSKPIKPIPWLMGQDDNGTDTCPDCPGGSGAGATVYPAHHHDAIYVCYCDTDPRDDECVGIFKGVTDSAAYFPCRRIVVSWDSIDPYGGSSKNNYMVVCYEGTNIIEIHVKNFKVAGTSQYHALIGIQNKTGHPQVNDDNYTERIWDADQGQYIDKQVLLFVEDDSPAAFWPDESNGSNRSYNLFGGNSGDTIQTRAWRFTPLGDSQMDAIYYRVFTAADGSDSLVALPRKLSTDVNNPPDTNGTNGYYEFYKIVNADTSENDCQWRVRAVVEPNETAKYIVKCRFTGATGFVYDYDMISDTIVVGVDTMKTFHIQTLSQTVCQNNSASFDIAYGASMLEIDPDMQRIDTVKWEIKQMVNGQYRPIATSRTTFEDHHKHAIIKAPEPRVDKTDTVMVRAEVEYSNGCSWVDTVYTYMLPLYSIDTNAEICKDAAPFRWQGRTYDRTGLTEDSVKLRTRVGNCDSVLHLHLKISDTMSTPHYVDTCDSFTWRNGKTYTTNNNTDTIVLHTALAGCDSIIRLHLRIHPYEAAIKVDPEFATLDQLDIELTDISTGTNERTWVMPDGSQSTSESVLYTMPFEADSAVFWLYAKSAKGDCLDTARVMVPMQRETFWVPNILLPDDAAGNNIFRISTTQAQDLECYIYNRQGQLVGHFEGIEGSWDCRDLNGNPVPQGSYVYVIRYTTVWHPEQTMVRRGTITLIR